MYNSSDDSLVVAGVQVAGSADIDAAVAVAAAAFKTDLWHTFSGQERAACMLRLADLIEVNSEKLGRLETLAMDVPLIIFKMLLGMIVPVWRCRLPLPTSDGDVLILQITRDFVTKLRETLSLPKEIVFTVLCDTSLTTCALELELEMARFMSSACGWLQHWQLETRCEIPNLCSEC